MLSCHTVFLARRLGLGVAVALRHLAMAVQWCASFCDEATCGWGVPPLAKIGPRLGSTYCEMNTSVCFKKYVIAQTSHHFSGQLKVEQKGFYQVSRQSQGIRVGIYYLLIPAFVPVARALHKIETRWAPGKHFEGVQYNIQYKLGVSVSTN